MTLSTDEVTNVPEDKEPKNRDHVPNEDMPNGTGDANIRNSDQDFEQKINAPRPHIHEDMDVDTINTTEDIDDA